MCPGFILVLISPARTVIWVHVGVSFLAAGFNALVLLVLEAFRGHLLVMHIKCSIKCVRD
jgi:hypothetical protein